VTVSVLKRGPTLIIQGTGKECFANYIDPVLQNSTMERGFRSMAVSYS
jgi:hypothetical protein